MMDAEELARHFMVITTPSSSRLMGVVERWKLPWWRYPVLTLPELSCFSQPLLMPLGLAGFDRARFNQGGGSVCAQFLKGQLKAPLEMAAVIFAGQTSRNMRIHRMWGEGTIFHGITAWMEKIFQKIAKNAPYSCISRGETRPQPTITTLFFERHVARERLVPDFWKDLPQLKTLAQTPMLYWVKERHEHICQQEIQAGHFLRRINVHSLNEETLGALFMNHILETILIQEMYAALG
jgi:hypothetical protein